MNDSNIAMDSTITESVNDSNLLTFSWEDRICSLNTVTIKTKNVLSLYYSHWQFLLLYCNSLYHSLTLLLYCPSLYYYHSLTLLLYCASLYYYHWQILLLYCPSLYHSLTLLFMLPRRQSDYNNRPISAPHF
jgi:hypothetical protein